MLFGGFWLGMTEKVDILGIWECLGGILGNLGCSSWDVAERLICWGIGGVCGKGMFCSSVRF